METKLRTGILSDEAIIKAFPLEQSINMKQAYLAPRVGKKIFIPKKAKWMINNMNLPKDQKDAVLKEFLRKSQMQEISFCCGKQSLNTFTRDNEPAVPVQTTSRVNNDILEFLLNGINEIQNSSPSSSTTQSFVYATDEEANPFYNSDDNDNNDDSDNEADAFIGNTPPDTEDEEDMRQMTLGLARRRTQFGQTPFDNPEVFEPRERVNVATPSVRRNNLQRPQTETQLNTTPFGTPFGNLIQMLSRQGGIRTRARVEPTDTQNP